MKKLIYYISFIKESESKFQELTKNEVNDIIKYAANKVSVSKEQGKIYMGTRLAKIMILNKFKSIFEPRAHTLFNNKPFIRYEKAEDGWYGFVLEYFQKSFIETFMCIKRFPSFNDNKELYVWSRIEGNYVVFTRHFFERYYQRIMDQNARIFTNEKIDDSIKSFMKLVLLQMKTKVLGSVKGKDHRIMMPFDNGFGLGYEIDNNILLMTFVDNANAKGTQKKLISDFMEGSKSDMIDQLMEYDLKPYKKKY